MSFPNVDPFFETFFEPTRIWLFGKPFDSLEYRPGPTGRFSSGKYEGEFNPDYRSANGSLPMPPKRIERTLRRGSDVAADGAVIARPQEQSQFFARIYSFSYEAHYYRLPRPLLFLVNSPGELMAGGQPRLEPDSVRPAQRRQRTANGAAQAPQPNPDGPRADDIRDRYSAKFTGLEARDWNFSNDIRVWAVDRKDLTVCLDVEIGNYQEILLDSMITSDRRDEDRATRSRGDLIGRGAGSFRGDMIGPHQNK